MAILMMGVGSGFYTRISIRNLGFDIVIWVVCIENFSKECISFIKWDRNGTMVLHLSKEFGKITKSRILLPILNTKAFSKLVEN